MSAGIPEDKTGKVVHYIVGHTEPSLLGATKLNKVMWHADVLHYRRYGKTITGQMSYVRLQNGPVPNGIYQTLEALKDDGAIVERSAPTPAHGANSSMPPAPIHPGLSPKRSRPSTRQSDSSFR